MKVFHCDRCDQVLFFENSQCVSCGGALAYVPAEALIASLPADASDSWASANPALAGSRRLVFTLLALGLPVVSRDDDAVSGLAFEFKADPVEPDAPRVFTGHSDGVITVNIAEADDPERERRRLGRKAEAPRRTAPREARAPASARAVRH